MTVTAAELLRLLQLASPALPVGAYSYSEGVETLIHQGRIRSGNDLAQWIQAELSSGAMRLDAAVMVRAHRAWGQGELELLDDWNQWLSATRETEELRQQSWQMGRSLLRLLGDLDPGAMVPWGPVFNHRDLALNASEASLQLCHCLWHCRCSLAAPRF
jgi:urease accessory protein